MKVVILAGGFGTRLGDETANKPKPMVQIGGKPIIWHIMKIYSSFGYNDFIILLGYKGEIIKDYFINYRANNSSLHIDLETNSLEFEVNHEENWKVSIIDTGLETNTGGRLKLIKDYIDEDEFLMTYGDGVGNIDISSLINFHRKRSLNLKLPHRLPAIKKPIHFRRRHE